MSQKPRKNKMDPRQIATGNEAGRKKREKDDWSFEDIARSKLRRR